jgi:flavin reductase (DIM6/NTAB) family NADH-FMN oxidoreductase RutF
MKIIPGEIKTGRLHAYMLHAVAPRPIAFASTMDKNGNPNLSPFSFFNAFGSKPPILVFSPARRVRDNTVKHTLENIYETKEVVINVVNYAIVQQASLSSVEFPKGTNEFVKSGLTPVASEIIRPFRVKESPVQMECIVKQVIETGHEGGAGNLIICEIVMMHVDENILDADGMIDQYKIDLVARMGADYYCRASGDAIFKVQKPNLKPAIGVDSLHEKIRLSKILTGNDLGKLGNIEIAPSTEEIEMVKNDLAVKEIISKSKNNSQLEERLHLYAKELLAENKPIDAWKVLMLAHL